MEAELKFSPTVLTGSQTMPAGHRANNTNLLWPQQPGRKQAVSYLFSAAITKYPRQGII
jgi:hypothetical protein